jgi:hypothetical protein
MDSDVCEICNLPRSPVNNNVKEKKVSSDHRLLRKID